MDFECAVSWNQQHPVGTCVWVRRVDGATFSAKTASAARQWGSFAIVRLDGHHGMWTTHALSAVDPGDGVQAPDPCVPCVDVARGA